MSTHVDDRNSLLDQLRMDRDEAEAGNRSWTWLGGISILAAGIAVATWYLSTIPAVVLAEVATAEVAAHGVEAAQETLVEHGRAIAQARESVR